MGRPRKTTSQLEATGAFDHDPSRRAGREHEPPSNGPVGEPPAYFDDFHRAIWFEVLDECHAGVPTKADRKILELIVRLTAKLRTQSAHMPKWLRFLGDICGEYGMETDAIKTMKAAIFAATGMTAQEATLLGNLLTRMGMTPADRSKVQVDPGKPADDHIDELLRTLGGNAPGKSVQ